jgi:cell division protein FtsB
MSKIKNVILTVWRKTYMKYMLVTAIGVFLVGFVGDTSVMAHLRNKQRINQLEEEIADYTARYQRDRAQIRLLNTNPKAMEKIARERYFMKADDEDIFILSDDDRTPKPIENETHETAE